MSERSDQSLAVIPQAAVEKVVEPALADDGVGITLEEARALLHMKHGQSIGKDDPILMLVTLFNAYLNEIEKRQKKHEAAMRALLNEETARHQQMLAAFQPNNLPILEATVAPVKADATQPAEPSTRNSRDVLGTLGFIALCAAAVILLVWVLK